MLISEFRYRPEIDGLRALAVLAVVLYHAGLGCPGGFVGVDVFFVISGYLITSLIVRDLEAGTFTILGFWQRRIRRIVPAMAVMVAVVLAAGWFLMLSSDYMRLGESAVWQVFFAANVFFWLQTGYFAPTAEEQPLLHTWSLAVEEQFYVVVPLALAYLFTFAVCRRRNVLLPVFVAVTLGSFAWSVYGVTRYPSAAFYLLPTRAWELSLGSVIALLPPCTGAAWAVWKSVATAGGLLLITGAVFGFSSETLFPGAAALAPCAGAAFFVWGTHGGATAVRSLLSAAPVVFVGKISYSLYLWHWPLFAFATYLAWDPLPLADRITLVAASFVLAVASYRYVEQPFRVRQYLPKNSQMPALMVCSTLFLASFGGFVWMTNGAPFRLAPHVRAYAEEAVAPEFAHIPDAQDVLDRNLRTLGKAPGLLGKADVVVWGDSHAIALAEAFDDYFATEGLTGILAACLGNAPVFGAYWQHAHQAPGENEKYLAFNDAVSALIRESGAKHVVLVSNWEMYADDIATIPLRDSLPATIQRLQEAGVRVSIMLQIPNQHFDVPKFLGLAAITGRDITPKLAKVDAYMPLSNLGPTELSLLKERGASLLDPTPLLKDANGKSFAAQAHGKILYYDGTHLTPEAAKNLFRQFLSANLAIEGRD